MQAYRPDRVVRVLTFVVSVVYFFTLVSAILLVLGVPLAVKFGGTTAKFSFQLPTTVRQVPTFSRPEPDVFVSYWNLEARSIRLTDVRGRLQVPVGVVPTRFVVRAWIGGVVVSALLVVFFHQLRRVFQRVRDGAPFDRQNATRLRSLGIVLLALELFGHVWSSSLAAEVVRSLAVSPVALGARTDIDERLVFIALVLIALAEIFRRGAALEEEQALVV